MPRHTQIVITSRDCTEFGFPRKLGIYQVVPPNGRRTERARRIAGRRLRLYLSPGGRR